MADQPDVYVNVDWDEVFRPAPDALWKLPPTVTVNGTAGE